MTNIELRALPVSVATSGAGAEAEEKAREKREAGEEGEKKSRIEGRLVFSPAIQLFLSILSAPSLAGDVSTGRVIQGNGRH